MKGRQVIDAILQAIENAANPILEKKGSIQTKIRQLQRWAKANQLHVAYTPVQSFITETDKYFSFYDAKVTEVVKNKKLIELSAQLEAFKKDKYDYLAARMDSMKLSEQEASIIQEFQELKHLEEQISAIYAQAAEELDEEFQKQSKDFAVVNQAIEKFDKAADIGFLAVVVDDNNASVATIGYFREAMNDLLNQAEQRFLENNKASTIIGGILTVLGFGLLLAAVTIVCPPAGLFMGLMIGGGVVLAGGLGTLFNREYQYRTSPMYQLHKKLEEESSEVQVIKPALSN